MAQSGLTPILIVPGFLLPAEIYSKDLIQLAPRRCVALSIRGRGRSDKPKTGYSYRDQLTDVGTVVDNLGLNRLFIAGYSTGAVFALGYAVSNPGKVTGVVVGDYPARYPKIQESWVQDVLSTKKEEIDANVAVSLQRDSNEVNLWDQLRLLECPVLILRGRAKSGFLTDDRIELYKRSLRKMEVVDFESGHNLWDREHEKCLNSVKAFVDKFDGNSTASP
jgi:pimeloyl-ACP methyl ester carboxylesterase